MQRFLYIIMFSVCASGQMISAQTKPDKIPTQAEIEAMMRDAEKQMKEAMESISPEERKMMEEAMGMLQNGNSPIGGASLSGVSTKIPKKQTELLGKLPKLVTEMQYDDFIEQMLSQTVRSIPANIRSEVDVLISKYSSTHELNNLPPLLFTQKNPKAAVYSAICVAQMNTDMLVSQNNLAVILHQTGYPQYALPLLEHLMVKNLNPTLYNNAAQCYLSLGDTQKAETLFAMCLQMDANNHEAHCGTALILIHQGKIPQAIPHVEQAMKNGYSPALDKLVGEHNIDLDFDKLKPTIPEYFNPNKYKTPHSAKTLKDVKPVLEERQKIEDLMYAWGDKNREYDEKHADKISKESVMQMSQRTYGIVGNPPFSRKAMFMLSQIQKETLDMATRGFTTSDDKSIDDAKYLQEELEGKIRKRYDRESFESAYEECVMKKEETEAYLQESAALYDHKVQATVFKYYDITNQTLYWYKYLLNTDGYEHIFYGVASELFVHLDDYKKFQKLDVAENVVRDCEKILENPPQKQVFIYEKPDPNCPIKVKIVSGPLNVKMDCKGWEVEGGELVILGIQKDYTTGELTLAFGVGANAAVLGAKGQMYFKFDGDYAPVDCGMVFEAGAEAGAGPIVIEEKATATIGMVSGIHVTGVAAGQETAIFTLEP
ncbi:tetratricopeptide repeat protein [Flagellimonas amoyensis]|uniref:tetratricopeptide repeat protein n=1 Tax=Flagellimonas amoyensis TaxID=2169401 RepID=UPI00131F44D4|nr:tetratricopeptide repeat protein [Allomuricauda amoyensis]